MGFTASNEDDFASKIWDIGIRFEVEGGRHGNMVGARRVFSSSELRSSPSPLLSMHMPPLRSYIVIGIVYLCDAPAEPVNVRSAASPTRTRILKYSSRTAETAAHVLKQGCENATDIKESENGLGKAVTVVFL
jgi:hypothetical protein